MKCFRTCARVLIAGRNLQWGECIRNCFTKEYQEISSCGNLTLDTPFNIGRMLDDAALISQNEAEATTAELQQMQMTAKTSGHDEVTVTRCLGRASTNYGIFDSCCDEESDHDQFTKVKDRRQKQEESRSHRCHETENR